MCYEMARLAILGGDPHHLTVLFRPPGFYCEADGVRWHGEDRFLVVRVPMGKKRFLRTDHALAPCAFDLANRTFTLVPLRYAGYVGLARSDDGWTVRESDGRPASIPSHAGEHFRDQDLRWAPWDEIDLRTQRFFAGWFGPVR